MKTFTDYEYLLIDIANTAGYDKANYNDRIQWTRDHFDTLESESDGFLFQKAVHALREVHKGNAINHPVMFDAVGSGVQILSAVSGDINGATLTGLIDTGKRPDPYTSLYEAMKLRLGTDDAVPREKLKEAIMTSYYGSRAKPREIFGDGIELDVFYQTMLAETPHAFAMIDILKDTWNPTATEHCWTMPDGFEVKVPVLDTVIKRLEIDELDHHQMSAEFKARTTKYKSVANIANVIQSIDAWVCRSMFRMCSGTYDLEYLQGVLDIGLGNNPCPKLEKLIDIAERTKILDISVLNHINEGNVDLLPEWMRESAKELVKHLSSYKPFQIITNHDSFGALPCNMNTVRSNYNALLNSLSMGNILQQILTDLYAEPVEFIKESFSSLDANYAIC